MPEFYKIGEIAKILRECKIFTKTHKFTIRWRLDGAYRLRLLPPLFLRPVALRFFL